MDSDLDLIDSLEALSYKGKCLKNDVLSKALDNGLRCEEFQEVVSWLAEELHILRKTDESISIDCTDSNEFAMELSALLKELTCPYERFVTGPLSERFDTREACVRLLEYLTTELMATKMQLKQRPKQDTYVISKTETNTARALEILISDLRLGKPPENISTKALFDKINFKAEEQIRQLKPGVLSEALLHSNKPLTEAQWKRLKEIHNDLDAEYDLRRQVLLTRLEVTIQSFQWSDTMKSKENEIITRFQKKLRDLDCLKHGGEDTNIIALLAARSDLAVIEKTSSANVRKNTASKIEKHVIGRVPDRGGRAYEHAPPPPEMPSWQQQRATGGGNFRGGRGGGGGGFQRGGGGNAGGGHWQQFSSAPQQQHQQHNQPHEQRQQFSQGRDQNWVSGSGRVQGSGWTQHKNNDYGGNNQDNNRRGSGGGDSFRGRSNYNRGGGNRR